MRLGVARHEDGLLRDQAAITRVGVGEGVERVGTGGDVRSAGDGERIASDVDAGDILVGPGSGDAPDRHADRKPGDDGRGGGDGGVACGRGRADDAEQRVVGALTQDAVIDDDAASTEATRRIEIDGRGIDDRSAGVGVRAGEGQRGVRLSAVGAGDDQADRTGPGVVDYVSGEEATAAIVTERRVPDVEVGGGADDAGGQITITDGKQTVAVVLRHDEAAVTQTQGVTLEVVISVRVSDVDRERADGRVRQQGHEARLAGEDVVGVSRKAIEARTGVAREAGAVDTADTVDRVIAGEDAIDDGPGAEEAVREGRGRGNLDAADAETDLAKVTEVIETQDRRGARRAGQRREGEVRRSIGPGAAVAVIGEDLVKAIHQSHSTEGLCHGVEGLAGEVQQRALQRDSSQVVDTIAHREVAVIERESTAVHLDRRSAGDTAIVHQLQRTAADQGRGGVIAEGMEGEGAAARLDELDVTRDQPRVTVIGINHQHRLLGVGVDDGATKRRDTTAGAIGVKRPHELGATIEVEHPGTADLEVLVGQERAGRPVLEAQGTVVDRSRTGVELLAVEVHRAREALGEASGTGDARGDREGLARSDVEDTFGPEGDDRHHQGGGRPGTIDEHGACSEGQGARIEAAEAFDASRAGVGIKIEGDESLVARERIKRRGSSLEDSGRRGREDVGRGRVTREGTETDGGGGGAIVGRPLGAVDDRARDDAGG